MPLRAQSPFPAKSLPVAEQQIEGVVTGLKKYSFTLLHDGKQYNVKLAHGAPVALKLNKPWYDWRQDRVVVDAIAYPERPDSAERSDSAKPKRVAVNLPAKKLYLISRFTGTKQMERVMSTSVKRINFYLVTPEDPGDHFPTLEEPFISGELAIQENQQVRLNINDKSLPIHLGFRVATMNGFSITQLEPEKTHVVLSGIINEDENSVVASRILFHPIQVTAPDSTK